MTSTSSRLRGTLYQTFLSLRNRNYRLFFIGQTISNTGNWLTNVALVLLVLNLTNSGIAIGLIAACQFGPLLLLSAFAGAVADRVNKRHLLFVTQSLEMSQSVMLAILAFMPNPPLWAIYAVATYGGVLLAFDNPLRRSFVTEMVPKEDIANAVVLYSTIVNVSRIFGPALAGVLVVTLGYGWCFTIDAASYIAVLVCLFLMRPAELYRQPRKQRANSSVRDGLRYVTSVPALWISLLMLTTIGLMAYNFNVTLPLFVTQGLNSDDTVYTWLYSIFSLGAVVSALVVARRNLVEMRHIIFGASAFGITLFLLAIVPGVATAIPVMFLVGVTSIIYLTATTAIIQVQGKPEMHGRVLALQTMIIGGSAAFGGPIAGWLVGVIGARGIMVLGGVVCLVTAGLGYLANRYEAERAARTAA